MPRVVVPVTEITKTGVAPAAEVTGDPAQNHYFANDSRTFLVCRNNGATPRTLTVRINTTVDGFAVSSRTVAIPATSTRYVGPFEVGPYGTVCNVDVDHADLRLSCYRIAG